MVFETPHELANRLKLGREEFCQRLLTTLILKAPYPRWNTRSELSTEGLAFLRHLWDLSGFGGWPGGKPWFVDEFELSPRADGEKGGAPDYAVLWTDRIWMMELKTEGGSHQAAQVPGYFELARHHHPECEIALTYLTPRMEYMFVPPAPWASYAHITWPDVVPLIASTWPASDTPDQQAVIDGLLDLIERMEIERPSDYLASLRTAAKAPEPGPDPLADALILVETTGDDGQQRALDYDASSLEELLDLRLQIRDELAASPQDSMLRCVMPWLWRPESGGAAMTTAGTATGHELRLSRYRRPLY